VGGKSGRPSLSKGTAGSEKTTGSHRVRGGGGGEGEDEKRRKNERRGMPKTPSA